MTPMEDDELIPLELYCTSTRVEVAFVESMVESGLVEVTVRQRRRYLPVDQLAQLDRLVRMHEDLDINEAGIEAIEHMLRRVEALQDEIRMLRNRLRRFEGS